MLPCIPDLGIESATLVQSLLGLMNKDLHFYSLEFFLSDIIFVFSDDLDTELTVY